MRSVLFCFGYRSTQNADSCIQFLQVLDPAIMPMGIITLEDVLEGTYTVKHCFSGVLTFTDRTHRRRDLR